MHIEGVSALVTGGARGLGAAAAQRLAKSGAHVMVLDRGRSQVADTASTYLGSVVHQDADVRSPDDVGKAIEVARGLGPLRIVLNCAGISGTGRVVSRDGSPHDLEAFRQVVEVNLIGTFNVLRLAAAEMASTDPAADGQRGVVINISSVAAFEASIGMSAYAAAKAGVAALSLPAARDLASRGIRVVAIAPGIFDSPMLAELRDSSAHIANTLFPKRAGKPYDEFAGLVEHIVVNDYLNGDTIRLDAGVRFPAR